VLLITVTTSSPVGGSSAESYLNVTVPDRVPYTVTVSYKVDGMLRGKVSTYAGGCVVLPGGDGRYDGTIIGNWLSDGTKYEPGSTVRVFSDTVFETSSADTLSSVERVDYSPVSVTCIWGETSSEGLPSILDGYTYYGGRLDVTVDWDPIPTGSPGSYVMCGRLSSSAYLDASISSVRAFVQVVPLNLGLDVGDGGEAVGDGQYRVGEEAVLVAVPDEGYILEGWYLDGERIGIDNRMEFVVLEDSGIEVRFKPIPDSVTGDMDGNGLVDSDDAIYLLYSTFLPDRYPLNQDADFNDDGLVDSDDAIYLLYHTFLPDRYPLHPKSA
jgi:hypothetical protein